MPRPYKFEPWDIGESSCASGAALGTSTGVGRFAGAFRLAENPRIVCSVGGLGHGRGLVALGANREQK
jgi:hypothetical protein